MAKRDIAGLLTGIPSGGIDPRVGMTGRQMLVQSALAGQERMASGLRGMFGGQAPIQQQLALAAAKKEREQQEALANLDLSNPEDLMTLAKIQQASGDLSGAVSTLNTAKQIAEKSGLKEGLLDIARAQGDDEMITFIESGGDLKTASTKLLKEKTAKTYSLTKPEKDEYDLAFDALTDKQLEDAGISKKFFGLFQGNKDRKDTLFFEAERIHTNNPKLSRPEALLQAIDNLKTGNTTAPTNGATPRRQVQQDKFSNVTVD